MTPLNNTCFIRSDERPKQIGSIIIPDKHRIYDLPNTGTVEAIAAGSKVEFKVGDRVMFNHHNSNVQSIPGVSIVPVADVQAIL